MSTFEQLEINLNLINKLKEKEITTPTKVQENLIPEIAAKKSVIFRSETGTGKTFAFLLPLFTRILKERELDLAQKKVPTPQPRVLVITPTHELASQIRSEADFLCKAETNEKLKLKTALLIGGSSITRQIDNLKDKPQIICGGPARIIELIRLKKLKTNQLTAMVLDEVDRLLSPELRDLTTELVGLLTDEMQLIACSATIKDNVIRILQDAGNRELSRFFMPHENVLKENITHWAFHAERRDKIDTLRKILVAEKPTKALVFSAETGQIANIVSKLQYKNINCTGLHSRTDKNERKRVIDLFRSGKCSILVTSDLAARGLDIQDISHIIQMDVPSNEDFFVHRAGRTARAGKKGINIVVGDEYELRKLSILEKKLDIIIYPKALYGGKICKPEIEE